LEKIKPCSSTAYIIAVAALIGSFFVVPALAQTADLTTPQQNAENTTSGLPMQTPTGYSPSYFPSDNISSILVFAYERGGGFTGPAFSFERTSYDSLTKQLVSISALGSPEIRLLSESEQNGLSEAIENNGFFEADSEYPPEPGAADFFTYSLSVIMDGKTHRVSWTDASVGVPPGIFTIVEAIGNVTAS
jgi:hypothetical protein